LSFVSSFLSVFAFCFSFGTTHFVSTACIGCSPLSLYSLGAT
jgi:hypothetical protein